MSYYKNVSIFIIIIIIFFISLFLTQNNVKKIASRGANRNHKSRTLTNTEEKKEQYLTIKEVKERLGRNNSGTAGTAGNAAGLRVLFHDRLLTMRKACQANKHQVPQDVEKPDFQFNIAPKQKLIMCKTAKHGTTTWSQYFLQIITDGKPPKPQRHLYTRLKEQVEKSIISSRRKQEIIQSLKNKDHEYMSFFVCRNPIEKLLSIFDMKTEHFLKHIRMRGLFSEDRKYFTWPEILSKWSKNWRNTKPNLHLFGYHRLQRIADSVFEKCNPCNFHYDAVVKMETFNEDARMILNTAGLDWVAPSHQNDRGSHSTTTTDIPAIFAQSSKEVIRGIIERYEMDFKICGYEDTLLQLLALLEEPS